jgi:hypothetical protein
LKAPAPDQAGPLGDGDHADWRRGVFPCERRNWWKPSEPGSGEVGDRSVEGQLPWGAVEMDDDDQEEVLVVDDADDDVLLDEDKATESQMRSFSE